MFQSIPEFVLKPDEYLKRGGVKIPAYYLRVIRDEDKETMLLYHGGESGSSVHNRHEPLEIIHPEFYVFVSHDENLHSSRVRRAVLNFLVDGGERVDLSDKS